jgi:hypothetical protein
LLLSLAAEMVNAQNQSGVRSAASLAFKNYLTSKDEASLRARQSIWMTIPPEQRLQMKNLILSTLGTEGTASSQAAQVCHGPIILVFSLLLTRFSAARSVWPLLLLLNFPETTGSTCGTILWACAQRLRRPWLSNELLSSRLATSARPLTTRRMCSVLLPTRS